MPESQSPSATELSVPDSMVNETSTLVLFTKPGIPGRVKTRLIGAPLPAGPDREAAELTASQAADLHRAFLTDLSDRLREGRFDLAVAWAMEDAPAVPSVEELTVGLQIREELGWRQEGDSLGRRLFLGLQRAAAFGGRVGAVGSDHPDLDSSLIEDGFRRMATTDVVIGPADDGGYYFIGMRHDCVSSRLFERIQWSTEHVLTETLERCAELGLSVELLEIGFDVDTPESLVGLAHRLKGGRLCPQTVGVLRDLGLLCQSEDRGVDR